MAWHGMAWHGMAWHGMAWHGMGAASLLWDAPGHSMVCYESAACSASCSYLRPTRAHKHCRCEAAIQLQERLLLTVPDTCLCTAWSV